MRMEKGVARSPAKMELMKFPFYWSAAVGVDMEIREDEWKRVETELGMSSPKEESFLTLKRNTSIFK